MNSVRLSVDCWLLIAEHLSQSDLCHLAIVSKSFHAYINPILYRSVDLSIHHAPPVVGEDGWDLVARWPAHVDIQDILYRQNSFMQLVLDVKPEYATWVRFFKWTMSLHRLCETDVPGQKLADILQLFSSLNCVISVDIDGGPIHPYPAQPSPPLFPAAVHVHLSGVMHYSLASAILHGSEKAPLRTLSLCNLHERGHTHSGENFQPPSPELPWNRHARGVIEEDWEADSLPSQVPPGQMRRLLDHRLAPRCKKLEKLTWRQVGQEMLDGVGYLPLGWYYPEDEIYEEWASFIQAIQPGHLVIQHDDVWPITKSKLAKKWKGRFCRGSDPVHYVFDIVVLPVLQKGWSELRKIEISEWIVSEEDFRSDGSFQRIL